MFGMRTGGPPRHYHRYGIITRLLVELLRLYLNKLCKVCQEFFAHWQLHIILEFELFQLNG